MSTTTVSKSIDAIKSQPIDNLISPLLEAPTNATLSRILGILREREAYEVFLPEVLVVG